MKKNIQDLLIRHKKFFDQLTYCNDIELIIDEVCEKTKLSRTEVKRIIDSQFKMLRQVMSNEGAIKPDSKFEDYKSIRIIKLGSYRPSKAKFEHIQKYVIEKDIKENV